MPARILVIRGGAIGDFILTLPAIRLLRENFPQARLEILGYPAIAALARDAFHADAVHSIEYGPLAGFFSRHAVLDPPLVEFFASFQQIISYLYDPDQLFETNLRAAGVKNLLAGPGKLHDQAHATSQLAKPLEELALFLEDPCARFFPDAADRGAADDFLQSQGLTAPFTALHPGSGSPRKNWPVENWAAVIQQLQAENQTANRPLLLVGGEADEAGLTALQRQFRLPAAVGLPLRTLGAILARSALFLGHDSGISHLAAAAGRPCLLLFGPTDPDIWGPRNPGVTILDSRGNLADIPVATVLAAIGKIPTRGDADSPS